jgi:hypothetical protein
MVELAQYMDNSEAFGNGSDVNELIKAMVAGSITGRDTTNQLLGHEPLKLESLDKTVKLLDFRMKDVRLWNSIPKIMAHNTVEEYLQLESYGAFTGGFYGEGEVADVQDAKYRRRAAIVKYIQVAGEVTAQAQAVSAVVGAMQAAVESKTMWIIRAANHYLTKADSGMVDKEFDGFYRQHASIGVANGDLYTTLDAYQDSPSVIDLRGGSIKQQHLVDAATNIANLFGSISTLFGPPAIIDSLHKDFYARQRIALGGGAVSGTFGTIPDAIATQFGPIKLEQDVFMKKGGFKTIASAASSPKAPVAPTATSQALTGADSLSRFRAGEAHTGALGDVFYAVSAINEYGESALTPLSNTVKITLTAGQSVDLKWTATAGAYTPTAYQVYRSKVTTATNATTGAVQFFPIFKVSAAQLAAGYDGAAATFVRDRNRFLPDTEEAFATDMNEDIIGFYQLMPIHKLDLATLGPSTRFMVSLWGTPRLAQPKKMVRFLNAGPYVFS